jgi:two-component system OmpR family sensor kinase
MRLATKLYLLFAGLLALAVIGMSLAYWSTHQARHAMKRIDLAHRSYEAHLSLSNHTYQLFKQFGDAMTIGDRDQGAGERALLAAMRADISTVRTIVSEEIELVGSQEVDELENLARIERKIEELLEEYESVLSVNYGVAFADEWGRLSRILDEKVDQEFHRLIQNALEEELREVGEAQAVAEAGLELNQRLALVLTLLGFLVAFSSLWWLIRDLREPIVRLMQGAEALARGELDHRIGTAGASELDNVARAFDHMAGEIATRERALEASRRGLEQAVDERTAELQDLLSTLEDAERQRRRLLADVSHELRTPLTIIRGEADIALRGAHKTPDEYREALQRTRDAARHTSRLVDDLLFIARREAGETRLNLRELDLRALLVGTIGESRSLADGCSATVTFHSALDAATVRADADRLRQVVIILLDNALRYGGRRIEVQLDRGPPGYLIRVGDDGPGIGEEEQRRVFERFFRGSDAANRYAQGTGLGLPVAKAIVEAHGGQILIDSTPGRGTRVSVTIADRPRLEAVP